MGSTYIGKRFVKLVLAADVDSILIELGKSLNIEEHDEIINKLSIVEGYIVVYDIDKDLFIRKRVKFSPHDERDETL